MQFIQSETQTQAWQVQDERARAILACARHMTKTWDSYSAAKDAFWQVFGFTDTDFYDAFIRELSDILER